MPALWKHSFELHDKSQQIVQQRVIYSLTWAKKWNNKENDWKNAWSYKWQLSLSRRGLKWEDIRPAKDLSKLLQMLSFSTFSNFEKTAQLHRVRRCPRLCQLRNVPGHWARWAGNARGTDCAYSAWRWQAQAKATCVLYSDGRPVSLYRVWVGRHVWFTYWQSHAVFWGGQSPISWLRNRLTVCWTCRRSTQSQISQTASCSWMWRCQLTWRTITSSTPT